MQDIKQSKRLYRPNTKWIWQGFAFLAFFILASLLLSGPSDPIFPAMIFSFLLICGMFFAMARFHYLTLENGTLVQHDLFIKRAMPTSDIEKIKVTKEGYFGATRISTNRGEIMLNHVLFDKETITRLVDDVQARNPGIKIEKD